jgi:cytochrome c peroxidase/DNA-binding beta-propeller fold protein YncE
MRRAPILVVSLVALAGCGSQATTTDPKPAASSSATPSVSAATSASARTTKAPLERREGQALARSPDEPALYLADEDHSALRRVALTPDLTGAPPIADPPAIHLGDATEVRVDLPGRPAQVFATGDRVLVTVRDPGLLMVFSSGEAPKELGRVALPYDAWGLAVSPDATTAYVTSAWSHKLTKIDLAALRVVWSIDVAREPRGVTVTADGARVYVSHLIGKDLTQVEVTGDPQLTRVDFPADPLRTLAGDKTVSASLGYAAILSPDGHRLFAARQALGALWSWQGNSTVDVLSTVTGAPAVTIRGAKPYGQATTQQLQDGPSWADHAGSFAVGVGQFVQPRAMIYRRKTHHLLVASEGQAQLAELDARSAAPGVIVNRFYRLGGLPPKEPTKIQIPPHCGAPTGIALSVDEDVAWVYCRSTDNLVAVRLTPDGARGVSSEISFLADAAYHDRLSPWGPFAYAKLAVPAATESFALGRRLFFDAEEPVVSGHMACAGCHPDGRDDGHVWREYIGRYGNNIAHFRAGPSLARGMEQEPYGYARQTPMLAGRVTALGPYGWHGESATIVDRIKAGFQLHRADQLSTDGATMRMRAEPLAEYLRTGLVAPAREARDLDDHEQNGKSIFESPKTRCVTCHVVKSEFTDRSTTPLRGFRVLPYFEEDPRKDYKVPSLIYVGSTAPYYHDGSSPTLEDLVEHDQDRMGHTSHLTAGERADLVAYLKTL